MVIDSSGWLPSSRTGSSGARSVKRSNPGAGERCPRLDCRGIDDQQVLLRPGRNPGPPHAPGTEMKSSYKAWLEQQGYAAGTVQTQIHRAGRVEEFYGDLDQHYDQDQLRTVIVNSSIRRAMSAGKNRNPSKIPFNGKTRNNLASYRNAVERYCKFRRETQDEEIDPGVRVPKVGIANQLVDDGGQLIGLERDLQAALRRAIEQLSRAWRLSTMEQSVPSASGFIDITAMDAKGAIVVVELRPGPRGRGRVPRCLSYGRYRGRGT